MCGFEAGGEARRSNSPTLESESERLKELLYFLCLLDCTLDIEHNIVFHISSEISSDLIQRLVIRSLTFLTGSLFIASQDHFLSVE